MVIEMLSPVDLDELEPLWNALREHHAGVAQAWLPAVREREDSWRRRRAQYAKWLEGDAFALVARGDDGRAIGYAFVLIEDGESPTWPMSGRRAEVETLAILPEARGGGVGAALIEGVRVEAARRDAPSLNLLVVEGNDAALRFYEREGFHPFARLLVAPPQD